MADEPPVVLPDRWIWVNIPHTWNAIDGQDGGSDYWRGTAWYAKEINKRDLPEADRYYIQFDGTNARTKLFVNGALIASHDGGYSAWRVDLTDVLDETNLLAVAVNNEENKEVYPQNADFTFYGGIYRDVKILAVSDTHFDLDSYGGTGICVTAEVTEDLRAKYALDESQEAALIAAGSPGARAGQKDVHTSPAKIRVRTWIHKPAGYLEVLIKDAEGNTVGKQSVPAKISQELTFFIDANLWRGTADPYLYTAEARIVQSSQILSDSVSTRFGVRQTVIDPDKGFFLNGRPYPLRGAARHQDRWEKGNALSEADQIEDMDLICEMGANTVRLAHYQHSQLFYDLCDERGIIVWAEIPYISTHMPGGRRNTIDQMKELITQNYNHPSIVVWGISNEITMGGISQDLMENHVILNDLVHEMDPTRPTVMAYIGSCADDEPIVSLPDVVSYNLYLGWYEGDAKDTGARLDGIHALHPDKPLGLSEYGADALDWHTNNPRRGDYTEEYQALYHEMVITQIIERPYLWATHVWNMFDFGADNRAEGGGKGQNRKGLVSIDRTYRKDAFYAYKAWLSETPFVHIAGKRYVNRHEEMTEIKVYSNLPQVELFVNGKSAGINDHEKMFFHFTIPNEGVSHLEARGYGAVLPNDPEISGSDPACADQAVIRRVYKEDPSYVMKDPGIVLNWFDITSPEGRYSLNDIVKDLLKSKEAADIAGAVLGEAFPNPAAEKKPKLYNLFLTLTVLRLANAVASGGFGLDPKPLGKEDLIALNEKLNKIPKQ